MRLKSAVSVKGEQHVPCKWSAGAGDLQREGEWSKPGRQRARAERETRYPACYIYKRSSALWNNAGGIEMLRAYSELPDGVRNIIIATRRDGENAMQTANGT